MSRATQSFAKRSEVRTRRFLFTGAMLAILEVVTKPEWVSIGAAVAYASRTDCPEWAEQVGRHVT